MTNDDATAAAPPIISLSSNYVVRDIEEACSTWGAFILVDHGMDEAFLSKVLQLGHEFFNLPIETKQQYNLQKHGAKWRGYMPNGGERSVHGTIQDSKEGMYMGDEHSPDDPRMGLPTFGSNVYPDKELPEMRAVFTEYHEKMTQLGNKIMGLLSQALGLEERHIEDHVTRHEPVILPRMFRYLAQNESFQENKDTPRWGIGEHSDYGLWTMILTDAPGLEFQHPTLKSWHNVPFVPNGIVMNVGDVLDRLTAGRFVSAFHRACNRPTSHHRLSLPFFYDPAWDARMETLPLANRAHYDTPERANRWSKTKITCSFDIHPGVEYSEFLAKKVAKVFPDLIPESFWKTLKSTSAPSTRHALVVESPDVVCTNKVLKNVEAFYKAHPEIKESHGLTHVMAVYHHACKAIACHAPPLSSTTCMEIKVAALLHDVDDKKYFPTNNYENARSIMQALDVPKESFDEILQMIGAVSCSENGNRVPDFVKDTGDHHLLIPRWADRLEAVGIIGVVRCYQYNQERGRPLSSHLSPRPANVHQLWQYATPQRFEKYQARGGTSTDMISHYYDKLLHVARPPQDMVRNSYLERMAEESSKELVEVCLRFGKTGIVDEEYIQGLVATQKQSSSACSPRSVANV